jgi:hypothetical protein
MVMKRADTSQEHLVPLAEGQWSLWRCAALRGSGFPAQKILCLASSECALAADQALAAKALFDQKQEALIAALSTSLDTLRLSEQWDDRQRRRTLLNALSQVKKGKLPKENCADIPDVDAVRDAQNAALLAQQRAMRIFEETWEAHSGVLGGIASEKLFHEAVLWQNRHAYNSGILPLLSQTPQATVRSAARQRKHEELIVKYLQRYCTKNDSIGFFGPIGWASLERSGLAITVYPGPKLLASRTVSFEQWCVDALTEQFNRAFELRPWIAPRRLPTTWLSGTTLWLSEKQITLTPPQAVTLQVVLDLCDGTHSASDIAKLLIAQPTLRLVHEDQVYHLLKSLAANGVISWKLDLPLQPHAFNVLYRTIQSIEDKSIRHEALNSLERLEQARQAVAAAADNPASLDLALGNLEDCFTQITGRSSTRLHGQTYSARALVYEDCRRDVEVAIGPAVWQSLRGPLSLLLTSARWLTFQVASAYREALYGVYHTLVAERHTRQIRLPLFWHRIQSLLFGSQTTILERVVADFQQRWACILKLPEQQQHVQYTSAGLHAHVEALFAAPRPGWRRACYHSPDIMIASASLEDIRRGHYRLVLGEFHVGCNTLQSALFMQQHPAPETLIKATMSDAPGKCIIPVVPKHWPQATSRMLNLMITPQDMRLLLSNDAAWFINEQWALPIGSLLIEETAEGLLVYTEDRQQQFDVIEVISSVLMLQIVDRFKIFPPQAHVPRVSIDQLVICRESWCFDGQQFASAFSPTEYEQFIGLRHWARQNGCPRYVFVRLSTERKPMFVDFDSPMLVSLLARSIRRACKDAGQKVQVTVTEMLPSLDETWLTDAEGHRYTCELRIVAVDTSGSIVDEDQGYL